MKHRLFKILYLFSLFTTLFFSTAKADHAVEHECTPELVSSDPYCQEVCFVKSADIYNSSQCKTHRAVSTIGDAGSKGLEAAAGCPENVVVNILDKDCKKEEITFGGLINRFIRVIPYIITIVAVIGIARGSLKIMRADGDDDQKEGFKGIINTAIGAGLFYSIWMILYLIEQFTGANLITFG